MISYLPIVGFVSSLVLALLLTPVAKWMSLTLGVVAKQNHRTVHKGEMPRLGGIAIFGSFVLVYNFMIPNFENVKLFYGILMGAFIIEAVGFLDDKFELSAKVKLVGQFLAAAVPVCMGLQVGFLNIPFSADISILGWLSIPFSIIWIVAIMNAINLIDGLDGLAAGVSAIATATILVMSLLMGNIPAIIMSSILLGSLLGFLPYNFNPAKIFMGDSGSLFIGYILAVLSIFGFKQITVISLLAVVTIFGLPIIDTILAMLRRKINHVPMFSADKEHIHHNLLKYGFSHKVTVLFLYATSAIFGLGAILLSQNLIWLTVIVGIILSAMLYIATELVGIFSNRKPILRYIKRRYLKKLRYKRAA